MSKRASSGQLGVLQVDSSSPSLLSQRRRGEAWCALVARPQDILRVCHSQAGTTGTRKGDTPAAYVDDYAIDIASILLDDL